MARTGQQENQPPPQEAAIKARAAELTLLAPVAGVAGSGRWLIVGYLPTSLFSLKISMATSSVGKTLLVPTPYSIKMALVDAAFRAGLADTECADFLHSLIWVDVRISPPEAAVVTHTFVNIRQEPHGGRRAELPYISNVGYREFVYHHGTWRWAFDLAGGDDALAERIVRAAPLVSYIGKRGSFVQYTGMYRTTDLDINFTQVASDVEMWRLPVRAHIVPLDDFGPEASLEVLSTYSEGKSPKRDRHRRFVPTVVPLGTTNVGPGFSEFRRD